MADKDTNPMAQNFGEMVTEWERSFDSFANQVMGTEAYSEAMNQMQKAQLSYQRGFSEVMAQQLAALNVPTREDVLNLADMIAQVNQRLERMEDKLASMAGNDKPKAKKKRPTRTRQPAQPESSGDQS